MKKRMWILSGFLLAAALLASERLEPERRVYPLAMGFDGSDQGYQVCYDMPELSAYTGESKPMEEMERIWYFQGTGAKDIESQIKRGKKQTPDMGHVQAVLLGADLMSDQEKYEEVLTSFVQEPMLGSNAYVFYTEEMEHVMEVSVDTTDSLGRYLVDIMDKNPGVEPVLLQDLYNAYYNEEPLPVMPVVRTVDNRIEVCG